jgi:hypothetical protein
MVEPRQSNQLLAGFYSRKEYCTENSITRKGKDGEPVTSMGTGIIHYLKKHLLGIAPVTPTIEGAEEMTHDDVLD